MGKIVGWIILGSLVLTAARALCDDWEEVVRLFGALLVLGGFVVLTMLGIYLVLS